MSDNIFVYDGSSSEYETTSEEDDDEEVQVIGTPKQMKFYEHTNYIDNTLKNMTVTIVVNEFTDYINWTVNFEEPIIVHKICDIYLDNFITHHCKNRNSKDNK